MERQYSVMKEEMNWNKIFDFMSLSAEFDFRWHVWFYNERNRALAKEIFRGMIDTKIAGKYHKNGVKTSSEEIS